MCALPVPKPIKPLKPMNKLLIALLVACLSAGCTKKEADPETRLSGPSVPMGNGQANAWLTLDAQGVPATIGCTIRKEALDNLPATAAAGMFMLALPDEARQKTPFQHVMINWNPHGHEPPGIYDVPHFDVHFYMTPMNEVMAIPAYEQAPALFDKKPDADYLPTGFVKGPGGVMAMGAHWSDVSSPEFRGQPFTETFVFGSYEGRVTFWEQMMALSYLKTNPSFEKPIAQPARYAQPGYYPTRYSMRTNADGSYELTMSQFVKR